MEHCNTMIRRLRLLPRLAAVLLLAACDGPDHAADAGGCAPGAADCACLPTGDCHAGLTCDDGLCRGQEGVSLVVTDPAARSCEAIVVEDATRIFGVDFGDGVSGTHVREAPRTAVAFHRTTDGAFAAGAATVRRATGGTLSLRRARCFDREGRPLEGEPLRLEE